MLELSSEQFGVVSRRQLTEAGISPRAVDAAVRNGRLVPVFRGVYGVGRGVVSRKGRWKAGLLSAGPGSALARRSAAEVWGFGAAVPLTEVVRSFNRRPKNAPLEINVDAQPNRLLVHRTRTLPPTHLKMVEGLEVTSPSRTLLDLAAVRTRRAMIRHVSEASRLGLVEIGDLAATCDRARGWHGARMLRQVLEELSPQVRTTRSEFESMFLEFCGNHEVDEPLVNATVEGFEVDCLWKDQKVIVELDGYGYHSGWVSFGRDRTRDMRLDRAGYRVRRVTFRMLKDEPAMVADWLRLNVGARA